MADALYSVISALLLGQSLLLISVLVIKKDEFGIYFPLCGFFLANAFNQFPAILEPYRHVSIIDSFAIFFDMLSIPAYLFLVPSLWLYVKQLTNKTAHILNKKDLRHFIPAVFAIALVLALFLLPVSIRTSLFGDTKVEYNTITQFFSVCIVLLMLTWVIQVFVYVRKCILQILQYRKALKDNFANIEGKELHWLSIFILLLATSVFVFVPDFLFGYSDRLILLPIAMDLTLFWFLGVYGLIQKPAFLNSGRGVFSAAIANETVNRQTKNNKHNAKNANSDMQSHKYEKSALTEEDMQRIAQKIKTLIYDEQAYLDNKLALPVLASKLQVPINYVSQTLNSSIGLSFFDYINQARVKHAKRLLLSSEQTVLDIAYECGFNSRSSFYSAFKKETDMTPTQYCLSNE